MNTAILPWNAQAPLLAKCVWPAQVITRWGDGCQIRISDQVDTIVPPNAIPEEWDEFRVRIEPDGIVVLPPV